MIKLVPVESDVIAGALIANVSLAGQGECQILHTLVKTSGEGSVITLNLPKTIRRSDLRKIATELALFAQALDDQQPEIK